MYKNQVKENLINRIKDEILISQIIGDYIPISRKGSHTNAVCPFHDDKNPSLSISDSKKMFKCFACEAAGDSITFVKRFKNISYVDAIKEICQKHGIEFVDLEKKKEENPKKNYALKILARARDLYLKMGQISEESRGIFFQFHEDRKIQNETIPTYQLGYAKNGNTILDYFSSLKDVNEKKKAIDMLLELGLIKPDKFVEGKFRDSFKDRIIFPIWDADGQVVGFTSRAVHADQIPKYLNSAESFIFNKGQILYGFHLVKNFLREKNQVIIVEGNMDQLALYQAGLKTAVAVMGVAISENSVNLLLRYTKNIYLAMDSDEAGMRSMKKINGMFLAKGILVKVINFLPCKDPDEFLVENGIIKLHERIDSAPVFVDYLIEQELKEIPKTVDGKLNLLEKIFEIVAPLKFDIKAQERILEIHRRIGLKATAESVMQIYQEYLDKLANTYTNHRSKAVEVKDIQLPVSSAIEVVSEVVDTLNHSEPAKMSDIEESILKELLLNPDLINHTKITQLLALFSTNEVKIYIEKLRKLLLEIDESAFVDFAKKEASSGISDFVHGTLFNYKSIATNLKIQDKMMNDFVKKLEREKLQNERDQIKNKFDQSDDEEERNRLLDQIKIIENKLIKKRQIMGKK